MHSADTLQPAPRCRLAEHLKPQNLEVQGQVFQRERKQPFGIRQQLRLQLLLTGPHWQVTQLADDLAGGQRQSQPPLAEAAAPMSALQCRRDLLGRCCPVIACPELQRLMGPTQHPPAAFALLQLHQMNGVSGNFHPYQ